MPTTIEEVKARAGEVETLIKWWLSEKQGRYALAMLYFGTDQDFIQETWLWILKYLQTPVDVTFSTFVLNNARWTLGHRESIDLVGGLGPRGEQTRALRNDIETSEDYFYMVDLRDALEEPFRRVPLMNAHCLWMRLCGWTLSEIANPLKVSRERVRQRYKAAMKSLRESVTSERVGLSNDTAKTN